MCSGADEPGQSLPYLAFEGMSELTVFAGSQATLRAFFPTR